MSLFWKIQLNVYYSQKAFWQSADLQTAVFSTRSDIASSFTYWNPKKSPLQARAGFHMISSKK